MASPLRLDDSILVALRERSGSRSRIRIVSSTDDGDTWTPHAEIPVDTNDAGGSGGPNNPGASSNSAGLDMGGACVAWELDGNRYRRRVPQNTRYESPILGLALWLDADRLRFWVGDAPVPYAHERLERVSRLSADAQNRVQQLEAELVEEQLRREEAKAAVAELRGEFEVCALEMTDRSLNRRDRAGGDEAAA